jgi:hypothetical protein
MREPGFIKRAPRVDTNFEASLTDSDGGVIPVIVTDISREGCRLEADGSLRIGERVQLEVPKYGTFPAQIRWALGKEAGAVFLEPINLP